MSEQEEKNVAMVIFAHPDDAEFGAAGTVAKWVDEGWDVYYVVCTDAAEGGPDDATNVSTQARHEISETRKCEQREAAKVLGVKEVVFLDYPDGALEPTIPLRRDLVRIIRQYRPDRIICQSPDRSWHPMLFIGRYHPDHMAAGQAALAAIYPAAQNPWAFPELFEEGLLPHRVKEVYFMGAPNPNFPVDISSTIEKKLAALGAHVSQHANNPKMEEFVRERSAEMGKQYNMDYVEVFTRIEK
jgi:LmbE family N-acetylglucosaminyl deacetylase